MAAPSPFATLASTAAAADAPGSLKGLREAGAAAFASLGFPSTRDEDWHYTNVDAIATAEFVPAIERPVGTLADPSVLAPFTLGTGWPLVVFLNGRFAPALSRLETLPDGIRVMDLASVAANEPELLARHLGVAAPADRDGFTALNAAFAGEGTLIHVAKEMVSDVPVHLLHVMDANGAGAMSHPRHLLVAERHAKATVVESYVALADVPYLTNAVVEAHVEDGATLHLIRI